MGKDGGDHPHLAGLQPGRRLRPRLDRAEHGTGDDVRTPVQNTGNGVAGHQKGLYSPFLHKPEHVPGHIHNGLLGVVPVWDVGAVAEIEDGLLGHQPLHLFDYTEAPNAGIQDADGAVLIGHGLLLGNNM